MGSSSSSTCRAQPGWHRASGGTARQRQQSWSRSEGPVEPQCPQPAVAPRGPPCHLPAAELSAGGASQWPQGRQGQLSVHAALAPAKALESPVPTACPCTPPRATRGCPITLICSASWYLLQKTSRPRHRPRFLAVLHMLMMLLRNFIFMPSSWQPGGRETNGERERGDPWPAAGPKPRGAQGCAGLLEGGSSASPAARQHPGSRAARPSGDTGTATMARPHLPVVC